MKVVLLTNDSSNYGREILNMLIQSPCYDVAGVVLIRQPMSYHWKLFNYVKKRVGLLEALYFSIRLIVKNTLRSENQQSDYEALGVEPCYTNGTNTELTAGILRRLEPDLIVLGQTGIVRANILCIPRWGTLNSHPGVLPFYRGIDSHRWAILNNELDCLGSTVHWVDLGVDTGNILRIKLLEKLVPTADELEKNLFSLCVENLADVLSEFATDGPYPGNLQEATGGKQYYKMPIAQERVVEKVLAEKFSNSGKAID